MRRAQRTIVAACALAACALAAFACGAVGADAAIAASPPRSIESETAHQILSQSLASARARHSVHAVEVEHTGALVITQADNSNERSGEQLLNLSSHASVDIRLFRSVLYIKANEKGIELVYGKRDPKYANKWVSVASSLGAYRTLASGIAFPSLLAEMPPTGALVKSTARTVAGHRVIVITGKPNQVAQQVGGSESFDVAVAAPHLPPRISARLTGKHRTATLVIAFSDWGHNFTILVPRPSISITKTNLLAR